MTNRHPGRRMVCRLLIVTAVPAMLALLGTSMAFAYAPDGQPDKGAAGETVLPLMKQPIPETQGKNVLLATVTFSPGQEAAPHVHPGSIFAYVLEGTVVSQLGAEPPKTYTQGQSWYEPPGAHHLVTRNPSDTQPAKLLVFGLAAEGEPIKKLLPR